MPNQTVTADYRTRYQSTPSSCGCPARAFRQQTACKHMLVEQQLLAVSDRKACQAAEARETILARYNTHFHLQFKIYVCSCDEWIESNPGAVSDGGSCCHTVYLAQMDQELFGSFDAAGNW